MEMLVLGATGSLGRQLTGEIARRGHLVRAASRRDRRDPEGRVRWVRVNRTSGEGLSQAVTGVDALIDAGNVRSARRSALDAGLVGGTRRVLDACHAAGDVHYVGISIVGIAELPYGYYGAKLRQERVIEDGPAPWSLLRATQFHDLVDQLFTSAARLPVLALPTAIRVQPIDVADVARRLVEVAEGPAQGRLADIGGPRVQTLGDLAEDWMRGRHRPKRLVRLPAPGRVGRALTVGALCAPQHPVDGLTFAHWLEGSQPSAGTPT